MWLGGHLLSEDGGTMTAPEDRSRDTAGAYSRAALTAVTRSLMPATSGSAENKAGIQQIH